jgi:hypothetical protein
MCFSSFNVNLVCRLDSQFSRAGFDAYSVEPVQDQIDSRYETPVKFEVFVLVQTFHNLNELLPLEHFHERRMKLVLPTE